MFKKLTLASAFVLLSTFAASAQTGDTTKPATKPAAKKPATAAKTTAAKPAAALPPGADPEAIFDTSMGKLKCTLFPKQAPKTVENFIGLANGTKEWTNPATGKKMKGVPLYDNTTFHRVIPNFMIQGGDPLGNGTGDPGYRFEDEFVPELRFDRPGRLAMANSGPATNGSQFFITEVPTPHLNDKHTIFGQCDDASVELVKQIARTATDPRGNLPDQPVKLTHITILGAPKKATPAHKPIVRKPATKPAGTKPATTKPSTPPKQQ
ncbi:MAG: Peptidyl-prolyl cis-trans isomerase [Candidatus Angelobacter sp.]|jgi:peptidyl-prolyl cis-trans isomerase A (cyclophilin A)|nr:Peptidyl-prolyl cis-trans isomerase [Candidatus Angelobacter sp.]